MSLPAVENDAATPHLDRNERREAEHRSAINAGIVHEAIRIEGEAEIERSTGGLLYSGLAAGLSMGFSMVAEGTLRAYLPHAEWTPLVSRFGYCFGFLFVILGRQQLFTENTLTAVLPLLAKRNLPTLGKVARLWGLVFAANMVGAHLFAAFVAHVEAFDAPVKAAFNELGREAIAHSSTGTFARAIFAGWIIATLVWLLPAAKNSSVLVIVLLTYIVALGGFSHIIAGSIEVLYLVMTGEIGWSRYAFSWMIPTLAGNVLGGVGLVAALNHAQAISRDEDAS